MVTDPPAEATLGDAAAPPEAQGEAYAPAKGKGGGKSWSQGGGPYNQGKQGKTWTQQEWKPKGGAGWTDYSGGTGAGWTAYSSGTDNWSSASGRNPQG